MRRRPAILAPLALLWLAICSCGGAPRKPITGQPPPGQPTGGALRQVATDEPGLRLTLTTLPSAAPTTRRAAAQTTPLPEARTHALLAKLPAMAPATEVAVELPTDAPPPPRAGDTLTLPFPPPPTPARLPATNADPALRVLRHAPQGKVAAASHMSLTFSAPMRALSGQDDREAVPVTLSPQPPGHFRWLGTRTLRFDAAGRFPMATRFRVTVPPGTRATDGATLGKAYRFAFETPPPQLVRSFPDDEPTTLTPVLVLGFDQRIDAGAMAAHVELHAGADALPLRPATGAELAADDRAHALVNGAPPETALALTPVRPLPRGARLHVTVRAGAPSAEGPLKTAAEQGWSFRTYGPLRVEASGCDGACPPESHHLAIRMSNPLDEDAFDPTQVSVSPAIAGLRVGAVGRSLVLSGTLVGRSRYRVTLGAALRDVFGQTLGKDTVVELQTAAAQPTLQSPGGALITLQAERPVLMLRSVNLPEVQVDIHAVQPDDWTAFTAWRGTRGAQDAPLSPVSPPLPGVQRFSGKLRPDGKPDASTDTAIDLSPHLEGGRGHFVVRVAASFEQYGHRRRVEYLHWVQVTAIGLVAWVDGSSLFAWGTRLADGSPLADAALSLSPAGGSTQTDPDGLGEFSLPLKAGKALVLQARFGEDVALLPRLAFRHRDSEGFVAAPQDPSLRTYTFDDRGLYKPGETAHVKGYLRRIGAGPHGDLQAPGKRPRRLHWTLRGPRGNQLGTDTVGVSAHGSFDLSLPLPTGMNLGQALVVFSEESDAQSDAQRALHHHALRVEAFRRPEFEVEATATAKDVLADATAAVDLQARYYAGGALPGATLRWEVDAQQAWFRPPNHDDFHFGRYRAWFWEGFDPGPEAHASLKARTDDAGNHRLGVQLGGEPLWQPMAVTARGMVGDDNRQTFDDLAKLTVHPAAAYPGLRLQRNFVAAGEAIGVDAVAVGLDGERASDLPLTLTRYRLVDARVDGRWEQTRSDPVQCTLRSATDPRSCSFAPAEPGAYAVEATLHDADGRESRSEVRVWVSGARPPAAARAALQQVRIVPDRMHYAPGQTARLLLQAPFHPARAVLTHERSGILQRQAFDMPDGSRVVELPITDAHVPGVTVHVELVGSEQTADGAANLPAQATGELHLAVPPRSRTLGVRVLPQAPSLLPGADTAIDIEVRDDKGAPLRDAELAVAVVDEAVLGLAGYQPPDPLAVFYATRSADVWTLRQRDQLLLPPAAVAAAADGDHALGGLGKRAGSAVMEMAAAESAMGGGVRARVAALAAPSPGGAQGSALALREAFDAAALFAPAVRTDAHGRARVPLHLPDSLTRYRVTVVAADRTRSFGVGEASMRASLPLMVRPSPPRFANYGDRFELPILVQNLGSQPTEVSLALRAAGARLGPTLAALESPDAGDAVFGVRVTVPADDRVEVRVPVASTAAGEASFQVAVEAPDGRSDAARVSFPVYTPATTEAFATYGELSGSATVQPVAAPAGVLRDFGGLSVTTSSTRLQALTDALLYLTTYPFECSEQLASRLLSVLALYDVLQAFDAPGLPPLAALRASVQDSLTQLSRRQTGDGGFAFWSVEHGADPYVSVHVARALSRAKRAGHDVDADTLRRAFQYVGDIDRHIPHDFGPDARLAVQAYAVEVLRLHGTPSDARALSLWNARGKALTPEAAAWLLPTLHDAGHSEAVAGLRRALHDRIVETAAAAHVTTDVREGAHLILRSDRRTDAVVLAALLHVEPGSELPGKLVEGLLGHRVKGRWRNTQENAFCLLALRDYFDAREAQTPRFVARAWLGERLVGAHRFAGRTTERASLQLPMDALTTTTTRLTLEAKGKGRMYYRLGMRYAPSDLSPAASDQGFSVSRSYEAVDDPADVTRLPDGRWRIRAGARVRVRLAFVAESERHHVALYDPLPAGLEVVARSPQARPTPLPALRGATPIPGPRSAGAGFRPGWQATWYVHENLRDARAEAFATRLPGGDYDYSYLARATTRGHFVVPPARAEEMYSPETFGRSAGDRVIVQ